MILTSFPDRLEAGSPYPLGANYDGLGINFAVFSANATRIDLCIFDANGRKELARLPLPECTDEVWHGYLPDVGPGLVYGYRAHGPYDPRHGHRFNPNKLLLDPYARQLLGAPRWSDALFSYRVQHTRADLSMDRRDSAPAMPKAVVVENLGHASNNVRPNHPWAKTFIYEAHVKGVSMQRDDLRPNIRGTFAALADRRFVDHLHRIGVTAIELLPIHAFLQDRFLVERNLRNYWGYSTLSYFAPEPAYLATNQLNEIRMAVRRLHAAGIEVILDVVFNHTCEGNELGPTFSWKGLDNASYYRLVPGEERYYLDYTGCGNTLNLSHPRVLQMVMDSLRYWAEAFLVDGFRFDLGVTLGREGPGFDPGSGFFDAIRQDPVLARLKIISEPWDLGPDGYQLGNHPPGFAEWNDKFRETTRRFWKGDPGQLGELAGRMSGSPDLFDRRHRRPWSSVNFVCAHDGFTLRDLVSYNEKHNDANGEENRDGHNDNASYNWGAEGDTDDEEILAVRARVQRAMLATLLLSTGTPMLLAGDEFGNTQHGNNNAYCQDNPISWLNWRDTEEDLGQQLISFVEQLSALRQAHPSLRGMRYMAGETLITPEITMVAWFHHDGSWMEPSHWDDPEGTTVMLRRAVRADDDSLDLTLVALNGSGDDLEFQLPPIPGQWQPVLDSGTPHALPEIETDGKVRIGARSVTLFVADLSTASEEESQAATDSVTVQDASAPAHATPHHERDAATPAKADTAHPESAASPESSPSKSTGRAAEPQHDASSEPPADAIEDADRHPTPPHEPGPAPDSSPDTSSDSDSEPPS